MEEKLVGKVISYDGNKKYEKRFALITRHYKQNVPESFNTKSDNLEEYLDKRGMETEDYNVRMDEKTKKITLEKVEKSDDEIENKEEIAIKEVEVFQVSWFNNKEEFSPYVLRDAVKVES